MVSIGTPTLWMSFLIIVAGLFFADLFLFGGRKVQKIAMRQALSWTIVWVSVALVFNFILWLYLKNTVTAAVAHQKALEFFTGYLIELSLSVDNLFVFILIFNFFKVPADYQRRVLSYGIAGAIVFRLIMITSGIWLVNEIHWILYVFGAFLIFTGIKMIVVAEKEPDLEKNVLLLWLRKHLRMTAGYCQEKFFIKQHHLWYVTPLFLVLISIEFSDLVFALDSIPAVFSITLDPFIVFTSNMFAILGLRAMYFLLANMAERFYLLEYGVAIVLCFVGAKMVLAPWVTIAIPWALAVVVTVLVVSVVLSVLFPKSHE